MKMTKIESARIIAESTDNPVCRSILCSKCFNSREGNACKDGNLVRIEKAKAYIKRHESKTKKKDHILDTTKKVEEPKPNPVKKWVKCIDNENGLLPLIIGKVYETIFIRHVFICVLDEEGNERAFNERRFEFVEKPTPLLSKEKARASIKKIDDYISANEPVKEPQPIKFDDPVPEYVYWLEENCITRKRVVEFVQKRYKSGRSDTFALVEGGENPYLKNLYRTLEEAVIVAKKLWNGDGK